MYSCMCVQDDVLHIICTLKVEVIDIVHNDVMCLVYTLFLYNRLHVTVL